MATILLVEDEHDIRVELRRTLEAEGHFVFTSTNGRDAVAALQRLEPIPDLMIVDLAMPFMSGDEFIAWVRDQQQFAHVPIMAISANRRWAPEGVTCFLPKPFGLDLLIS